MGLYDTYRPTELDGIVGNIATVEKLNNILTKPVKPHVGVIKG